MVMLKEATANVLAGEEAARKVRAQRFELQVPLRYRTRGENAWRRGETENISASGVLFRGDVFADVNTSIELSLIMPVVNTDGTAEVVCQGKIVRAAPAARRDLSILAAKILHFRLVRP